MKETQQSSLSDFINLSQPQALLVGALFYALGGGIVNYLGQSINWTTYWLGQACVTMLQLSSFYLKAVYDLPVGEIRPRIIKPILPDKDGRESTYSRSVLLMLSTTTLTIGAVITVLLFANGSLNTTSLLMIGLAFGLPMHMAIAQDAQPDAAPAQPGATGVRVFWAFVAHVVSRAVSDHGSVLRLNC